jgi:hypothetical protein
LLPKTADEPSADGKDASANAVSDQPKQHAQSVSNIGGSQDSAQSGNQNQSSGSPSDQGALQAPVAAPAHLSDAVSHVQDASNPVPLQTALDGAPKVRDLANPPGHVAPPPDAPEQPLPTISSARLIQTMGQSELRVGLRSSDFGNISISTSSIRDVVSAQISLDHGELAKTLAAHLPEIQARLGADRPLEVRIDMNGQATGQGTGTSTGFAHNSAGSNGDRQQRNAAVYQPADSDSQPATFVPAAVSPISEIGLSRLDIRV